MFGKNCEFKLTEDQYQQILKWDNAHVCTLKPRYGMKKYRKSLTYIL